MAGDWAKYFSFPDHCTLTYEQFPCVINTHKFCMKHLSWFETVQTSEVVATIPHSVKS